MLLLNLDSLIFALAIGAEQGTSSSAISVPLSQRWVFGVAPPDLVLDRSV